ncbi:MAG: hypothetical protein V6Z89_15250 [Desulfobacter sp.]
MIDLQAFSSGFGLVVISLLLGIIIRAILSALSAGSSRFNSIFAILFVLLSYPDLHAAVTKSGPIDLYRVEASTVYFNVADHTFHTSDAHQIDLIKNAYYERTSVEVSDHDTDPGQVHYIQVTDTTGAASKIVSLIIGALSCNALAIGLSLRI